MDDSGKGVNDPRSGGVEGDSDFTVEGFSVEALVTARGTGEGLTLRLDGRAAPELMKKAISEFVSARKGFLQGNRVTLQWVGSIPTDEFVDEVKTLLSDKFSIEVSDEIEADDDFSDEFSLDEKPMSLFDGMDSLPDADDRPRVSALKSSSSAPLADIGISGDWDEADGRVVFQTLRSGQKVETEHSLVICGDVNSGAEIIAGGDIIVLGTLRGVAHAGAYDETGGGRFIFSLDLRPTQLRIGSVISRGSNERSEVPEMARVEGDMIVVEPYRSRNRVLRSGQVRRAELQSV